MLVHQVLQSQATDTFYKLYLTSTIIGVGVFLWQALLLRTSANAAKASAKAAEKAASVAEQTLRLTPRADVLIDSVGIDDSGAHFGPHSRLVIQFKNFGNTRATGVSFKFRLTSPGSEDISAPAVLPSITQGGGSTQRLTFQSFGATFKSETFKKIVGGESPMRFDGVVNSDSRQWIHKNLQALGLSRQELIDRADLCNDYHNL